MSKTHKEQISRVEMMASGSHDTWDLSDNDVIALSTVLSERSDLLEAFKALLADEYFQKRLLQAHHGIGTAVPYGKIVLDAEKAIAKAEYRS